MHTFALRALVILTSLLATTAAAAPDPLKQPLSFTADARMKFVLVGDSTVTDDAGWARGFRQWASNGAEVINLARGGRSSGSFIAEGRWAQALSLKPDYVLIQFGHNDEPGHGPDRESDPATTYRANITRYVDESVAAGIKPVLVTPLARRQWKDGGRINSSLLPYANAVKAVATEKQVPVIDLHERSLDWYHSLGRDAAVLISPRKSNGDMDGTHLNEAGGVAIGAIVADALAMAVPETDPFLNNWRLPAATTAPTATTAPATAPARAEMPPSEFAAAANAKPAAATSKGSRTITVAEDGSGDFRTIQEAVAAAPANNTDRTTIRIKPGVYYGCIVVPRSRPNLSFIGDDADSTILTYALNVRDPVSADVPPKMAGNGVIILGDGFRAENITFQNTSGDHGQAMALRLQADRVVLQNCRLLGWQDTLLAHSKRQYLRDCHIEGRVDFIYGGATTVFDRCTIKSKNGGYVTAASTPAENPFGYVFLDCKLTSDDGMAAYLGRPWRAYGSVAFLRCEMGPHVHPQGWHNWGNSENEKTARYAEYRNTGPGAARSQRVAWSRELTDDEAAALTPANILAGDDGWDPNE